MELVVDNSLPGSSVLDEESISSREDHFLSRFVYMTEGNQVADTEAPKNRAVMKLQEFNNTYAADKADVDGKQKPLPRHWLESPKRRTVRAEGFYPGKPVIYQDDYTNTLFNTYQERAFQETSEECLVGIFLDHISYLFPEEDRRELILNWLACTVHRPAVRIKFVPLIIALEHGTGRGWIAELLGKLLGQEYVTTTKISVVAGQGGDGQWQNYLYKSLCCVVHEVHESKGRFSVNDKVRDIFTESHLALNIKHGANGTYQVFANFLLFSNYRDALVIPKEDRRIWAHVFEGKPKNESYYKVLYNWLEGDGPRQVYWWLHRRMSVVDFNPGMRAPITKEKTLMALVGESNLSELYVMTVQELPPYLTVATAKQVALLIEKVTGEEVKEKDMPHLAMVLNDRAERCFPGVPGKQIKWRDCPVRPWIIRDAKLWRQADNDDIRGQLDAVENWVT